MKNKSFVRLWAPLIAALFFGIAFLSTHLALNAGEKTKAVGELNALLDMAETRAAGDVQRLNELREAADQNAIHKARTIERFLAHDDNLLATDALAVLAELLDLGRIAVVDDLGSVIAASDESLIGKDFAADEDMAWVMALLEHAAEPGTGGKGSERIAGAQRTDIEGLVLVWNHDALLQDALSQADLHTAVTNLAAMPNQIKLVDTTGESGVFEQDGMLYVQRSLDEVTLIAWQPASEVYAVQNGVLIAIVAFAVLTILVLFLWQAFFSRGPETDEDRAQRYEVEADLEELEAAAWTPKQPRRSRPAEPEEPEQELPEEAPKQPRKRRLVEADLDDTELESPEAAAWTPTKPRKSRRQEPELNEAKQEAPEEDIWSPIEPQKSRRARQEPEIEPEAFEKKRRRLFEIIDSMDEDPEEEFDPRPSPRSGRQIRKVSSRSERPAPEGQEDDLVGFDKIFD